jgi:3-dehydroquinate synthetase
VLRTLEERTYRSGLAEAVKHGLIADEGHLAWIEANASHLLARDLDRVTMLVRRSVEIKTVIVEADEQEAGMRALLNAGHTVAHALEQATAFAIPHGEAVAIGLALEAAIGEAIGATETGTRARIEGILARLGLPASLPAGFDPARLFPALARDKKSRGSVPGFVFIESPGRPGATSSEWITPVHPEVLHRILPSLGV